MFARFDVFQVDSDGHLRWLRAFETLEEAHACVARAIHETPGPSTLSKTVRL